MACEGGRFFYLFFGVFTNIFCIFATDNNKLDYEWHTICYIANSKYIE